MTDNLMYMFYWLGTIAVGLFSVFYLYFRYSYKYWQKRGVPYLEPSFPFGNLQDVMLLRKNGGMAFKDFYNNLKGKPYGGIYAFAKPTLVLRDPGIIKTILVKDFIHFQDHGTYYDEETDPLMAHLFMMTGTRWKNLRAKLTPTFTSGKMKMMFQVLADCGESLKAHVADTVRTGNILEVKDIMAKFSTDVIASCAFGIQCNCLENPGAEFRTWGRKIFETSIKTGIRDIVMFLSPTVASILKIPFVPKDVTEYFTSMVKETVNYREKNNITRNDFMQLLIKLKNQENGDEIKESNKMNGHALPENKDKVIRHMEDLAAQAFVFFVAGFETSSTTMSFCLYELALNPDVQERVQNEIDSVLKKHGNKVTYEAIQEMDYLDRVVAETLRKYPPVPFLPRVCTQKYVIPETDVVLQKGSSVTIPVLGLHNDPEHFPNPKKFDPDRFTEENKNKRHHFTYLPFGEGPRLCIGMRFGLMQTKVGLVSLLSNNTLKVCKKTPVPLKMDAKSLITSAEGGMWLQVVERKNSNIKV